MCRCADVCPARRPRVGARVVGARGEFLRCVLVVRTVVLLLVPGARYMMTCVMTPMTDLTLP